MKKLLAFVLMTAVLVCPVLAAGEAAAASEAPHYVATTGADGVVTVTDSTTGAVLFTFETTEVEAVAEDAVGAVAADYYAAPSGEPAGDASAEPAAQPAGDASAEPAGDASAEPAGDASAEPAGDASAEPAGDASAEEAAEEETAEVANPNYDPAAHNWNSICVILALAIVVIGAGLMLSFGKKKN